MVSLKSLSRMELNAFYQKALADYEVCKEKKLKLDMSRGKPSKEQLDLSNRLLALPTDGSFVIDGMDVRNYGMLEGLPSCRALFADVLGVKPAEVFVGGNSSLSLMYGVIAKAHTHGLLHSEMPWSKLEKVKFLCPSPGYDRHFTICESFGMEMIPIPMTPEGPDMDAVEALVSDAAVKGMWCVPKYSNPEGIIYSDSTIARIAALKPAAPDFVVMWDNAYCVHEFEGGFVPFKNILSECANANNPDMVFEFASTSKVTFAGGGVSCFACSVDNMKYVKKLLSAEAISFDKINQMKHVLFLKGRETTLAHMQKHAQILKPKFDAVMDALDRELIPLGVADYNRPMGGYFISLNTLPGCAKRTHKLMMDAGVIMTPVGATYPYGLDPEDKNLRIAPSFPPIDELQSAMDVLCVCVKLAAAEKLLGE